MTLLSQLGERLGMVKRTVKTNHTFCPKCPMSEDKAEVVASIRALVDAGEYPQSLWG